MVDRISTDLERLDFDRLYGEFADFIDTDARGALRRSADRHLAWVRGDCDHLT